MKNYYFQNRSYRNSKGFVHESKLVDDEENIITTAKVQYYNRTWEPRPFYTTESKAVEDALKKELISTEEADKIVYENNLRRYHFFG